VSDSEEWASATRGYDVSACYGATHGKTTRRSVAMPDWFMAKYYEMEDRRSLPPVYQSFSDFIRDAAVHRLQHLSVNGFNELESLAHTLMNAAKVEQERMLLDAENNCVRSLRDTIEKMSDLNDVGGVQRTLEIAKDELRGIRPPLRRQLIRIITNAEAWLQGSETRDEQHSG